MEEEDVIGTTAETDRTNSKKVGGLTLIGAPKYTWNVRNAGPCVFLLMHSQQRCLIGQPDVGKREI
jgi:hypothetical protein